MHRDVNIGLAVARSRPRVRAGAGLRGVEGWAVRPIQGKAWGCRCGVAEVIDADPAGAGQDGAGEDRGSGPACAAGMGKLLRDATKTGTRPNRIGRNGHAAGSGAPEDRPGPDDHALTWSGAVERAVERAKGIEPS